MVPDVDGPKWTWIDFTNKPGRSGMRSIPVAIDNFSCYMMTVAKTDVGRKVLDKVISENLRSETRAELWCGVGVRRPW